nr:YHYH protein [Rhodopirellula europaea]
MAHLRCCPSVPAFLFATLIATTTSAHDGHSHAPSPETQHEIVQLNTGPPRTTLVVQRDETQLERPAIASVFEPFRNKLAIRYDRDHLFVESNGMPDHSMMVGITAWQQQVPLPQKYTGNNAWSIPLHPVPAKKPMLTKDNFFRGALAANGIPIFNPIKNDGKTDTLKAGELDQWGGHCGRADDYHYHIAPVHLEKIVGVGNPLAVALDGYPIYGYNDPNGMPPTDLDHLNGHKGPDGKYHYHATTTFPYLNGGFYGEVVERDGQVDPQPRAQGVRPALRGLKGAKITGFEQPEQDSYIVRYEVYGEPRSVEYTVAKDGSATFQFVTPQGTETEHYTPRQRGSGEGRRDAEPPRGNEPSGQRRGGNGQSREGRRSGRGGRPDSMRPSAEANSRNAGGPRGPQPGDGPRQPWILVHADEIDLGHNNIISRDEIVGEATKAFAGYDTDNDGQLTQSELAVRGGSRSAMAGFLKGHAKEIDRDNDGIASKQEAISNAERMFQKIDTSGDGEIQPDELETSRRK